MNRNNILEFLEIYKNLDELCRQILSSDRGVSEYIDEMDFDNQRGRLVAGWERDYKQLKRMRWIRNRLVHEVDAFDENLVNVDDIEWLHIFYNRIMECSDPFSLLHQSVNINRKADKQLNCQNSYVSTNRESLIRNWELLFRKIILAVITIVGMILLGIVMIQML